MATALSSGQLTKALEDLTALQSTAAGKKMAHTAMLDVPSSVVAVLPGLPELATLLTKVVNVGAGAGEVSGATPRSEAAAPPPLVVVTPSPPKAGEGSAGPEASPVASWSVSPDTVADGSVAPTAKRLSRVITLALKHEVGFIFAEPVTDDIAPGYGDIVTHPMDLGSISAMISDGVVTTWAHLVQYLGLMIGNALTYNEKDSHVYTVALSFGEAVLSAVQEGAGGKGADAAPAAKGRRSAFLDSVEASAMKRKVQLDLLEAEGAVVEGSGRGSNKRARRG